MVRLHALLRVQASSLLPLQRGCIAMHSDCSASCDFPRPTGGAGGALPGVGRYAGKKLLILGANPETAGLVVKANEMGLRTYVTDYDSRAFAKSFATDPINVDASHVDDLYDFFLREGIDGVAVGVAETLLLSYGALCESLGLPSFGSPELFSLMVNKARFKETCRAYDVPVVEEFRLSGDLSNIKLPVVTKPVDSCSSRGISVCTSVDELKDGIDKALEFSKSGDILIERYMTGDEVVIYYVFQDGVPSLVGMCDRYTYKGQAGVAQLPTSYIFPSRHLGRYIEEVDAKAKLMFRDIGIENGSLFIQSFIDEDGGARFYEPGFRLNGAQECYILGEATGVDVRELYIDFAMTGRFGTFDVSKHADPMLSGKWGCKLSPLVRLGRIGSIRGLEEIAELPDVVSVNPSYREGDVVDGYGTLKQVVCRFFIVSDTKVALAETIDAIESLLEVEDAGGESILLPFFDTAVVSEFYSECDGDE